MSWHLATWETCRIFPLEFEVLLFSLWGQKRESDKDQVFMCECTRDPKSRTGTAPPAASSVQRGVIFSLSDTFHSKSRRQNFSPWLQNSEACEEDAASLHPGMASVYDHLIGSQAKISKCRKMTQTLRSLDSPESVEPRVGLGTEKSTLDEIESNFSRARGRESGL